MLRVAVVEKETVARDFIFDLRKVLIEEFSFTWYSKIVDFVHDPKVMEYDIIAMDETYNNVRISSVLNLTKSNCLIIYTGIDNYPQFHHSYSRIFNINTKNLMDDLLTIKNDLNSRLLNHNEYLFSYNGVTLKLKYNDIYYIEKEEKNLVYHTKKGEFYERGSIAKKSEEFADYDFVRINSGIIVNFEYIFKIEDEEVELHNHVRLPISRSRKPKLMEYIRRKTKTS